jgi:hypothetical protein
MATIYRCDKCRAESTDKFFVAGVLVPIVNYSERHFQTNDTRSDDPADRLQWETFDLCPKCVIGLKRHLQPDAVVNLPACRPILSAGTEERSFRWTKLPYLERR